MIGKDRQWKSPSFKEQRTPSILSGIVVLPLKNSKSIEDGDNEAPD